MKQTAVELLEENYRYVTWLTNRDEITASEADKMRSKYFEQSKEMEKQQQLELIQFLADREDFKENSSMSIFIAEDYLNQFKNK